MKIPPFGRGFSRHGVYRSDAVGGGAQSEARTPRFHRLDEPTRLSLGMVASQQWDTRPMVWTIRKGTGMAYADTVLSVGS